MGELRPNEYLREQGVLRIVDQSRLPGEVVYEDLATAGQVYDAIRTLRVRGAPAIGIAAAYGAYLGVRDKAGCPPEEFRRALERVCRDLCRARPTAVNLSWALNRMQRRLESCGERDTRRMAALLLAEADSILAEDEAQNEAIARHGLSLLHPGMGLLTHCNAGPLATSRYGTALGPMLLGQEKGYGFHVYADETRPLLQGARLTAFELERAGVDVTLCCDGMAASLMAAGRIQACLVGCDRVVRNGDTANKIGTLGVAVLAHHFGIPFYVLGPSTTLDPACPNGAGITIEQRDGKEVTELWYRRPMAPEGVKVYNPAFDVTPAGLITAIVTERGIARPPYKESLPFSIL